MRGVAYTIALLGDHDRYRVYEVRQFSLLVTDAVGRQHYIQDCTALSYSVRRDNLNLWLVLNLNDLNPAQAMRLEPQFALGLRNVPMTLRMYARSMQWPLTGAITSMLTNTVDGVMHRTQSAALPAGFTPIPGEVAYMWPRDAELTPPPAPEA